MHKGAIKCDCCLIYNRKPTTFFKKILYRTKNEESISEKGGRKENEKNISECKQENVHNAMQKSDGTKVTKQSEQNKLIGMNNTQRYFFDKGIEFSRVIVGRRDSRF